MWIFWVLGIIVAIIVHIIVCILFASIAADKGYNDKQYFWICFFLGTIGYLMIVALPDRNLYQLFEIKGAQSASNGCDYGEGTSTEGKYVPSVTQDGSWVCSCGRENAHYITTCACGINKRDLFE